jgi:heme O synthase-like polyprenyltransferase
MNWKALMRADFGARMQPKTHYDFKDKLFGFLSLVKPPFIFMTPFNAASAAVLAINGYPHWDLVIGGFFCAFLASIGANIFNRYADRERDKIFWPDRAIPSGRIRAVYVLMATLGCYLAALLICWRVFNATTMIILAIGLVTSSLYSTHLRDHVGYLSLPPIEGTIFLAGWAALAPGTLFTLTPWVMYLIGLFWQASHIMSHYMLHIKYAADGKPRIITPAFFNKPSPRSASYLILLFILISFALSIWLIFLTSLSYIYMGIVLAAGINAIVRSVILAKDFANHEKLHEAWSSLSLFKMAAAVAVLLDILVFQTIL